MLEGVLVQLDAEAWAIRQGQEPVGIWPYRLGEHEVAALGGPPRRVVRKLKEGRASDAGGEVEIGEQPDPVRPRVRREPESPCMDLLGKLARAEDAD